MKTVGAWEGCPTRPGSGMLKTLTGEQGVGGGGGALQPGQRVCGVCAIWAPSFPESLHLRTVPGREGGHLPGITLASKSSKSGWRQHLSPHLGLQLGVTRGSTLLLAVLTL